jgi:Zn-dependent peptidase ImmA (M78 family)/DNA-binding XRE family transcriptional regulator
MKEETSLIPARLRIARKMAGLSLEDLSRKISRRVTRQALSKYEKGLMSPSPAIFNLLEGVLNLRKRIEPLPLSAISSLEFRKSAPLSKKNVDALKQLALEYLARYEELERLLGRVIPFRNPIPGADIRTMDNIEKAAVTVRSRWNLGLAPIGNFLEVLESNGIKVFEINGMDGMKHFDGLAARSDRGHVIALNMNRPPDRIRFTAAHELAHILCDFNGAGDKERLCHVFAGALLLPRAALEHELVHRRQKITLWELGAIKEKYGISLQALMHRARDLNLITPRHLRDFMTTIKTNDWSIVEPVAYRGKEEAARFMRLLNYAIAEKIIGLEQAAVLAGTTEAKLRKEIGTMM